MYIRLSSRSSPCRSSCLIFDTASFRISFLILQFSEYSLSSLLSDRQ